MALHDAPAEASCGFRLFILPVAVASGSDRLGTIDLPCLFECRAIVPNGSTRRASGGVLRFSAVCLNACGGFRLRSIGDNRSTMPSVEPLSPMALHDAPAEASYGFRLLALTVTVASSSDRLGTIDLPCQRRSFESSDSFSAFLALGSTRGFTLALARPLSVPLLRSLGPASRPLPIL
jgi:hypothetical protein